MVSELISYNEYAIFTIIVTNDDHRYSNKSKEHICKRQAFDSAVKISKWPIIFAPACCKKDQSIPYSSYKSSQYAKYSSDPEKCGGAFVALLRVTCDILFHRVFTTKQLHST